MLALTMASLRQRHSGALFHDDSSHSTRPILKSVANVDLFPKPKEEYRRVQTAEGAVISVVAASLIAILVLWEFGAYVSGRDAHRTELSVDSENDAVVPFHLDITFPRIPCHELSVDTMDAVGDVAANVDHDLYRSPVDRNGRLVFQGKYRYVPQANASDGRQQSDSKQNPRSPNFCGSCYIEPKHHHQYDKPGGVIDVHLATVHKDTCCNTCESVMKMYDLHRIPRPQPSEVEQCINELSHANPGCNLRGFIHVKKVMGNFHFAPGVSAVGPMGQHIHLYDFEQILKYNTTHIINKLEIGDPSTKRFSSSGVTHPLSNMKYTVSSGFGHVKYFIHVVPASYSSGHSTQHSFEYSAQVFHREAPLGLGSMIPSVFFVFDFHPMQVNHIFVRPPVSHLFVQVCGIVGGLFVVLGIVDRIVESAQRWRNSL
jgi:hypothetical protein